MGCEFRNVGKSYGDIVAVENVSFGVKPGEVLGLLGPNGAGKTSLIRILMDILRPTHGEVFLFGEPLQRQALDRVGYLPEERGLYKKLKVIDVLTYFGTLKGLSRATAKSRGLHWLERVKLPQVAKWRVERLSKGMSQKVQIAATFLSDPELCVLDEPFSGLDPVNVRLVKDFIDERRKRGLTTILSTHQMSMVEELCDRVALIHAGQLVVYGNVDEVRREYTPLEVIVRADRQPPQVQGVIDVTPYKSSSGGPDSLGWYRMRLEPQIATPDMALDRSFADVLARLVKEGLGIDHYERVLASIEDIFLQVVGEQVDLSGDKEPATAEVSP